MPSCSASPSGSRRPWTRRRFVAAASSTFLVWAAPASGQEGVSLRPEEAPRALFPDGERVTETRVAATEELRRTIAGQLDGTRPSRWEAEYRIFEVERRGGARGYVVIVEEIGKHQPIDFAVAVTAGGRVHDVAVLVYREPYGGEIRHARFLAQYRGKGLDDRLLPYRDVRNISGATLSVEATGRAVRKAIAVLRAAGLLR